MNPTITVADNLRQTKKNQDAGETAFRRLAALGWEPLPPKGSDSGQIEYPGSDKRTLVMCVLPAGDGDEICGWVGERFYSHLGRNRPVMRHPAKPDGTGCVPILKRPYDGQPIRRDQPVLYPYSARVRAAAWLNMRDARETAEADPEMPGQWRVSFRRAEHVTYRWRVLAVGADEREAIKRARLRGVQLPKGTHAEVMGDLVKNCQTEWIWTPYGLALLGER